MQNVKFLSDAGDLYDFMLFALESGDTSLHPQIKQILKEKKELWDVEQWSEAFKEVMKKYEL